MKIIASILTGLLFIGSQPSMNRNENIQLYVSNYENVLGTSLEFKFTSVSEAEAEKAEQAALKEIDRLSAIFSAYNANSEFSRWMKKDLNTPVKVSKELFDMLQLFEQWKKRTNGALDASTAIANSLWKDAAKDHKLPTTAEINAVVSKMKQTHYLLNEDNLTATRLDNVPLVMNTFAKSYIINRACDAALAASAIRAAVVNIGGDLVIKGDINDVVRVTDPLANAENDAPLDQLLINNRAVATSGNYRRGEQIGTNWYSHIIDPRTGKPVDAIISATVIAPNATDAGALATAFNVLSIAESKALAETVKDANYLIITSTGKRVESKGWAKLVDPMRKEAKKADNSTAYFNEKLWDAKHELSISFELNAITGNSHRPFAAVWVENESKQPVRNLALWYNKTKWVPDLRNWYRINGESFKANKETYASVTGATRSPGKYTIKWDGKDDKGNYVPQGKYTIMIESSKEHGTDEIIRQPMELKKVPKKVINAGNVEISNVTFEFRKK
jgi:thiamine biosynthesis lipoprotein